MKYQAGDHWTKSVADGIRNVNDGVDTAVDFGMSSVDEIGDCGQYSGVNKAVTEANDRYGNHEDKVVLDEWY